jgi:VIT1/CCC1 family predicted Fe2+/Mn2+ transporter
MMQTHRAAAFIRHYLRVLVYGANDGIITTFAVVAGVTGGALSASAVMIIGTANLAADGLSMGLGNYLSIRAHESARRAERLEPQESSAWRHAVATLVAFVTAGVVPLLPFVFGLPDASRFAWSVGLTLAALFVVGAARGVVTADPWWRAGVEMLALGAIAAVAAYGAGYVVAALVTGAPLN